MTFKYGSIADLKNPPVTQMTESGCFNAFYLLSDGKLFVVSGNASYLNIYGSGTGNYHNASVGLKSGWHQLNIPYYVTKFKQSGHNAIALCSNGNLYAWGHNAYGQCGVGHANIVNTPTLTATGVSEIWGPFADGDGPNNTGSFFIKKSNNYIYTCGYNGFGNLGLGDTVQRNSWTAITALGTAITNVWISSEYPSFTMAWSSSLATLYAFGWNGWGQLGDGTTTNRSSPIDVTTAWGCYAGNFPVNMYLRGYYYNNSGWASNGNSYMWRSDSKIVASGCNYWGQLANGTRTASYSPVVCWNNSAGATLKDFVTHGIGSNYVLTSENHVYFWGYSGLYQSMIDNNDKLSPTLISGLPAVDTILNRTNSSYTYQYYSEAFFNMSGSSTFYAAGYNDTSGYLGTGSTTQPTTFSIGTLPYPESFIMIGSFSTETSARTYVGVTANNKLFAWGYGGRESFGSGSNNSSVPVATPIRHPATY